MVPVFISLRKLALGIILWNHQTQYLPPFRRLQNGSLIGWSNAFFKTKINIHEWFIGLLKYVTPPENVNAPSLDIIMNMYIPRSVKERIRGQRSANPGPNVHVMGLHQKMPQGDDWERFLSNGDNKNKLIALFVKFLKSLVSQEYRKYII